MQRLVKEYGAADVWRYGCEYLQYPPTLAHTAGEAMLLAKFISDKAKGIA